MKHRIDQVVTVNELKAEHQNKVLDFASHLIAQSGDSTIDKYLFPVGLGAEISLADRRTIQKEIRNGQWIRQHPVAAMLVSNIGGSWVEKNVHKLLKTYVLLGVVRFPEHGAIHPACRRVRLMNKKNSAWLFDAINAMDDDLPSIVEGLESIERKFKSKPEAKKRKKRRRQLEGLRVLLSDYLNGIERDGPGPRGPRLTDPKEVTLISKLPDYVSDGIPARVIQGAERESFNGAIAEPIANQTYLDFDTKPAEESKSYPAKQERDMRYALDDIRMRACNPPCIWSSLTDNEVHLALRHCFDATDQCASIPHALVILGVLLGRQPSDLLGLPVFTRHTKTNVREYWYVTRHRVGLTFQLPMPDLPTSDAARELVQRPMNRVSLSVPTSLQPIIRQLAALSPKQRTDSSKIAKQVDKTLKQLNKEHLTLLTETKIAAFMHARLAADGIDDVVIKRIRGFNLKNNVPQHYDGCQQSLTQSVFDTFVADLLTEVERPEDWAPNAFDDAPLGSLMVPKKKFIRSYFRCWRDRMQEGFDSGWDPVFFHNEYVLATYSVLSVCTGHRPVRQMFENINDFDPVSSELLIRDKKSRFDTDSRCIVLPAVGCEQFVRYREHLEQLQKQAWGYNSTVVAAARRALSGDGPLLFRVIPQDDGVDVVETFDPGVVQEWLGDRWPLALNWTRHFLCTEARAHGFPFEAVNAKLGHADISPAAFDRFSCLSFKSMMRLADQVGGVLSDLEITAIRGLS